MIDKGEIFRTYTGSDGEATRALYVRLEALGPVGIIAANLFRATKNSARAKVYRGGNRNGKYRDQAYERKAWAIRNLTAVLMTHAKACGIVWGWGFDVEERHNPWLLFLELPTGQVSFHTAVRCDNQPDFPGKWDGVRGFGPDRVCRWCNRLMAEEMERKNADKAMCA